MEAAAPRPLFRRRSGARCGAGGAGAGGFLSWNAYTAAHLETHRRASVGSGGLSYGQVLFGGLAQFLGIDRTGKFADLMGLMADALFYPVSVSLVGRAGLCHCGHQRWWGRRPSPLPQKGAGRRRGGRGVGAGWPSALQPFTCST